MSKNELKGSNVATHLYSALWKLAWLQYKTWYDAITIIVDTTDNIKKEFDN